ncbi:uncharacterized protein LOC119976411 [Scyliorhinus canicula]|uniref:uncharacterized protein LOC119976411 n=1 Tax=Scyliorhinus canicula TaxID=7830 RepID=UPI0018F736D4|nr:uncharacterized protein LOC119976411 [Scyliorhinus canicula]
MSRRHHSSIFLEPRVCLEFEIICNISNYQARSYNQSRWIGVPFAPRFKKSFGCLKNYARGQNSQGSQIQMTAQFLISFNGSRPLNLFWLLPKDLQANPPLPVNGSRVFLTNFPQMFVYSKTVRTKLNNVSNEADAFNASLARDRASYNNSINFAAFCKRGRRPRPRLLSLRKEQGVAETAQQMVGDVFDEEGEVSGDGEWPLPFEEQAEPKENRRKKRRLRRRQNRARCYDIWFISNGYPICPVP